MPKKIVICCDGTWNTRDQKSPTNVVRIHEAVLPTDADGQTQVAFYHQGVGTNGFLDRWIGGAFGFGLSRCIRDVYRYLVEHFEPGDELFFFGFSRGAYTARSTVGFIHNCGILRPEHADKVDEAYAVYRDRKNAALSPSGDEAKRFREAYSYEPRIRFVGVWDTVGALGIPLSGLRLINLVNRRWQFHDVELSRRVDAAFQALAIDERRGPFRPAIWRKHPEADGQQIEQVWFTGVHSDIGGGYPERELAEITMAWMVERARACGLSIGYGAVAPDPFGALHDSMTLWYRMLKQAERTLDATDPLQCLASTAYKRHEQLAQDYSPENLVEYLSADGTVRDV